MAPLPKRKHSSRREGKRKRSKLMDLPDLVVCKNCGKQKLPHRLCKHCVK